MKKLNPVEVAERLAVTAQSVMKDYDEGKLSTGSNTHPVKRLDDDWDPEEGISNENMMRLIAERLEIQGILVYFNPEVVRETIIAAAGQYSPE